MGFLYETHCHTNAGSKCSELSPEALVTFYHRQGYNGICITDHFTGSSILPDDTPWEDRVDFHYDIYLRTKKYGDQCGLSVFFGLEYAIVPDLGRMSKAVGNDFLLLNISKDWLRENQAAFREKTAGLFLAIRESGGFIIHAHPFAEASWIEYIRLLPRDVDAVETLNTCGDAFINGNAKAYARAYNLLETAGSDCHSAGQGVLCGLETDKPCHSALDLITAIREGRAVPFEKQRID